MTLIEEIDRRQVERKQQASQFEFDRTLLVAPLALVHFVLAYLVRLQYAQEVSFSIVLRESWLSIPIVYALLSLPRSWFSKWFSQISLMGVAVVLGSYLVYIANEEGYFATMKQAPPLGTLFAWIFIELTWYNSVFVLAAVAAYTLYRDYSL